MFVAPDPGLLRLRVSARAVLGVGAAVGAASLSGLSLRACITGGLAALLALFTVTDTTAARQAVTTALLPVAGLPVLALAAELHAFPLVRDTAFLGVVFCGVYARRWGPRGHALGIFAFMMFFAAQFLHADTGMLLGLSVAVALALVAAAAARFLLWPIERHMPAPATPALPVGRGLAAPTTRQAFQATLACTLALAAGQVLSHERWYWAVGAAWWIFVNTASRGETLVRGFRRVLGTVCGIPAGLLLAVPIDGAPAPTAVLTAVCVAGIFYTAPLSYSWMMFWVTVMVGLLYGLLGVLHPGLLALRIEETAVGALAAGIAVAVVLPVTTHAATDAWIQRALICVRHCAADAARRIAGDTEADPASRVEELEQLLGRVRVSLAPLLHPLNPLRARAERARQVVRLLDDCAVQVRGLAESAADPDAAHGAQLGAACHRVEAAVQLLVGAEEAVTAGAVTESAQVHHPGTERALAHLHRLESALSSLAGPLRGSARSPLALS